MAAAGESFLVPPTFPPLISLRLNGLAYVTQRLPRFDSLNILTDPFERRGFTPNVPAKPVPMPLESRGLVLNGKENRGPGGGGGGMYRKHPVSLARHGEKLVGRIVAECFTASWEDRFVCNEFGGKLKKKKINK